MPDDPENPSLTDAQRVAIEQIKSQRPMPFEARPLPGPRRIWLTGYWIGAALSITPFVLGGVTGRPVGIWGIVAFMAAAGVFSFAAAMSSAAAKRVLIAARGLLCPTCHYQLPAEPASGVCSECGTRYDRDELIRLWRSTYRMHADLPLIKDAGPD